jgi:hypothetical protein
VDEVRRLKASDGPALHIWGSSELLQTLIAAELIDEYQPAGYWTSDRETAKPQTGRLAAH